MDHFNIAQARARLSELVRRAAAGEEIVIAHRNKPLVKLMSIARGMSRRRLPGSAIGMVSLAADLDRPLDDFETSR